LTTSLRVAGFTNQCAVRCMVAALAYMDLREQHAAHFLGYAPQ
jgi:hypothetical protein